MSSAPVIKWSGSKRSQALAIKQLMPTSIEKYYEPFIGGGSILYELSPIDSVCGDVCTPLIDLWNVIKNNPEELSQSYEINWNRLQNEGYEVYYEIRDRFNKSQNPCDLLFLSRTCVNGLIRFNQKGEFNNSLHHTRKGIDPKKMTKIIFNWSAKIQASTFINCDYHKTTENITKNDFVYLDPPYFNTKGRYYGTIDYDEFCDYLEMLNSKNVKYILSYDGKRGDTDYVCDLPAKLYKRHILLPSGNSSFKKVQEKKKEMVFESVYLNY